MTTLLQLDTSIFGAAGASSRLTGQFVTHWLQTHPEGRVIHRDLGARPIPHLAAETFQAAGVQPEERSDVQQGAAELADTLIAELKSADVLVLGAPMYNFGVSSQLKSWFDHVARAGATFRYTSEGPQGLMQGKKVLVFSTRGGKYAGTPNDLQTAYLRQFLGFLGMTDVEFVYAEGLAGGTAALDMALAETEELAA